MLYGTLAELELFDGRSGETIGIPGRGERIELVQAGRLILHNVQFLRGTVGNQTTIGAVASLSYRTNRYVPRRADESKRKREAGRRICHQFADEGGQPPIAVCLIKRDRCDVVLKGGTYKIDRSPFGELGMIRN